MMPITNQNLLCVCKARRRCEINWAMDTFKWNEKLLLHAVMQVLMLKLKLAYRRNWKPLKMSYLCFIISDLYSFMIINSVYIVSWICVFSLFSTTFCFILLFYECLSALVSDSSPNHQIIQFNKYYNY